MDLFGSMELERCEMAQKQKLSRSMFTQFFELWITDL